MEHASFWKEFFTIYKDLPALWRVKSTEYTDRNLKAKCYMKLIRKLKEFYPNADRIMVVKKINNFRTAYRKELKRMKECRQMGKAYRPTLWYFDYLRFLDDQDEGWDEKATNEIEQIEEKKQESPNVIIKPQVENKPMTAPKRSVDIRDNEEECLANPAQRRKLAHHFYKKSTKKPSLAEQQEAQVDAEILARSWAVQYKEMKGDQKLIARKLISDIFFYGCLGTLTMNNAFDMQEIFTKKSSNSAQLFHLESQSPVESNSSFHFAEQEILNYNSMRESPIEFNSSSPPTISPTTNCAAEMDINDIKFEVS